MRYLNYVTLCCSVLVIAACTSTTPSKNEGADTTAKTVADTNKPVTVEQGAFFDIPEGGEDREITEKYPTGVIKYHGYIKKGKRNGQWNSFYENGKPWSENNYKDGVLNGPTTTWYENGNVRYKGTYANGVEYGVWTYWDESGQQSKEVNMSGGK